MKTNRHLSVDQISTLAEIIREQVGSNCSLELVTELALAIFEDIAGLESITHPEQQGLISEIYEYISKNKT